MESLLTIVEVKCRSLEITRSIAGLLTDKVLSLPLHWRTDSGHQTCKPEGHANEHYEYVYPLQS